MFLILFLFFNTLFGSDLPIVSTGWEKLAEPPKVPLITSEVMIEGVNVITGTYTEDTIDLVTKGIDPLTLERCYCRETNRCEIYADLDCPNLLGWYANYDYSIWYESFPYSDYLEANMAVAQRGGNFIHYIRKKGDQKYFPRSFQGYMNHTTGILSGQNHLCNSHVVCTKNTVYQLQLGDGTLRYFTGKGQFRPESIIYGSCFAWEKKPSGNLVRLSEGCYQTTSADERIMLNWLRFTTKDGGYSWTITNSDNRTLHCHPGKDLQRIFGELTFLMQHIVMPDGSRVTYRYNDHTFKGDDFLIEKVLPDGRFLKIDYAKERVSALKGPIGRDQKALVKYRFDYGNGYTDVWDANQNRKRYEYDENKRIVRILHYQGAAPYRIEINVWNEKGSLLAKLLKDPKGDIYMARRFFYDERQNVICEKVFGTLTGTCLIPIQTDAQGLPIENGAECYTKTYTYSNDRFNLLLSESDSIATTTYHYYPETNLLKSTSISDNHAIRLRSFRKYDRCSALSEWIEDDGCGQEMEDLSGCTLRRIKRFFNKITFPGVGQPEILEESYYNFEKKCEELQKRVVFHYNSHNECVQEDVFDGEKHFLYSIHRNFDACGRCIYETDPLGNAIERVFDANGNLIKEKGPHPERTIENGYDFANRLIWTKKSVGKNNFQTTRFLYDLCGNKISEIDVNGNETHYIYDFASRQTRTTYPQTLDENDHLYSACLIKSYDIGDNITEWKDERGEITTAWYTIRGSPYKTLCEMAEQGFEYDLRGNLIKKIASDGTCVKYSYDFLDRLIKTEHCDAQGMLLEDTSVEYNAFSIVRTKDAEGVVTHFEYDFRGREKKCVRGHECYEKTYDSLGFLKSLKQWQNESSYLLTSYISDFLGRKLEESVEDEKGKVYSKHQFSYDANGACTAAISYLSETATATTFFSYDGLGREIEKHTPEGNVFQTLYVEALSDGLGGFGSEKKEIDPKGNVKESFLDARGRVIRETLRDASQKVVCRREFRYDGCGNKTLIKQEQSLNKWQEVYFSYGAQGKLTSITNQSEESESFFYDTEGRLIRKNTPLTQHIFCYDALGRVISHTAIGQEKRIHIGYLYDKCGRVKCIEQNGRKTLRDYDENGNMTMETQESGFSLLYAYDRLNRKKSMSLPDGSFIGYHYEGPYLQKLEKHASSGKVLYTHTILKRDLSGKMLKARLFCGEELHMSYDLCGRQSLIQATNWQQRASYDACGNLISLHSQDAQEETVCSFGFDGLNQLLSENENIFSYDGVGNCVERDVGPCNQLLKCEKGSLTYDAEGRLSSSQTFSCTYDPLDRMVSYNQTTYAYDGLNRRIGGEGVWFLYDGNQEIGTLNAEGNLIEFRLAEESTTFAVEVKGKPFAVISDIRQCVGCLLDPSGKVAESYRYTAFGQISVFYKNREHTHSQIHNPWQFFSKRVDETSGWIFFGRRYYDASVGRFTTPDPLGFAEGINLYLFAHNNPLTHSDLYGYLDRSGPLESRSCIDFLGKLFRFTMGAVEWMGKNMIPIPGVRDVIESIGRWGAGGKLFTLADYHTSHCQSYTVPGTKISNVTIPWINGVWNSLEEAKKSGAKISEQLGGLQIIVFYNASHGLATDLMESLMLKLGGIAPAERIILNEIRGILQNSPNETIIALAHSQGGLRFYNAGRELSLQERQHIEIITLGSAKLIPRHMFSKVDNIVSCADIVPIFDTINYFRSLFGNPEHVTFVAPTHYNPFKEHMILESTYMKQIDKIGNDIKSRFL